MSKEWFIQVSGAETGPFSGDEIREKASVGDIDPDTLIKKQGSNWFNASKISNLEFGKKPSEDTKASIKQCPQCGKPTSLLDRDMISGLCLVCKIANSQKHEKEIQASAEVERAQRSALGGVEPLKMPIDGLYLIGISGVAGLLGALLFFNKDTEIPGCILLSISAMLYLAGVIRWAVSGAQSVQLDRLHRQNREIIKLLELIADDGNNLMEVDKLRELRDSGKLADDEFNIQRRELLKQR